MNMLLLRPEDILDSQKAEVKDQTKITHVKNILKKSKAATLNVGLLGGLKGKAEITELTADSLKLCLDLNDKPPQKIPLTLFIALPRPKVFLRTIFHAICLGVEEIHFINTYKVEKPYWSADQLKEKKITEIIHLALEQCEDTQPPKLNFHKLFKPFAEDVLPGLITNKSNYIADPSATTKCPYGTQKPTNIAIGPEGGWLPYELDKMQTAGFTPVHLGKRILRVDTAVCALSALFI
ncbi:MAG: 16S rRNA (uracil(1498)-N(3))-methyltransferase [Pseudobdellovibrionaceae bacterium]